MKIWILCKYKQEKREDFKVTGCLEMKLIIVQRILSPSGLDDVASQIPFEISHSQFFYEL